MNIAPQAKRALNILIEHGFGAYLVGGCVRDIMLGGFPKDWDITTSAKPQQIQEVFVEFKTVATGIRHGTITVIIDDMPLEVTTYRIDGEYSDNRHPDKVIFSKNLNEDVSRRDFTINAICLDVDGNIVDYYDGKKDIDEKTIRCVGEPNKRFREDGLRILRALRFSASLGFEIEEQTKIAIHENKHLLRNISGGRIFQELTKLVCGIGARAVLLEYDDVADVIKTLISGQMARMCNTRRAVRRLIKRHGYDAAHMLLEFKSDDKAEKMLEVLEGMEKE